MIGKTIKHYKILDKLGEGGMGVVYKAEDTKLKRTVALKFLPQDLTRDPEAKERFVQEAQAASALEHQNICNIHEIDETPDGQMFIVMGYYEGGTLKQKISREPLRLEEAVGIAAQVALGLERAHEANIIHRDIKPANLVITERGEVKIVDFGLAKLMGQTRLTKAGTTVGTVAYMSPEQARGGDVDHRTDIWSLGVVLYEMITGRLPFKGEHEQAVIYSVVNEEPEPMASLRAAVPVELERIVNRCIAKAPDERYRTVADLVADLCRLQQETTTQSPLSRRVASSMSQAKPGIRRIAATTAAVAMALVILLVVFNVWGLRHRLFTADRGDTEGIESLAVLPFVNTGSDEETEYLGDEIPASVINSLSRLSQLRVVPRSTVFRFRGREDDLGAVGRELNVRAILTGQISVRGERLSIRTELVDVVNDRQLWGDRFTHELDDIFALEEKIATEISSALRLQLTGEERHRLTKRNTQSAEAHRLYLKGRYFWNKRTEEGLRRSIGYFQQAIDEDPTYALAYAGIADANAMLGYTVGYLTPQEVIQQARTAALKALEIDDELAEAHASLGLIKLLYDWDWTGAESDFKRAIELDPSYATAFHWYSLALLRRGQRHEAVTAIKRAQELDPLSFPINVAAIWVYLVIRQYDQAIEECNRTIDLDPNFAGGHAMLGVVYTQTGMYEQAINELRLALELSQGDPEDEDVASLGYAYAMAGMPNEARKILDRLHERAGAGHVPPSHFAMVYAGLGEEDQAFRWLEEAYDEHDYFLIWRVMEPTSDPIRDDPRFNDLLGRMGLDPTLFAAAPVITRPSEFETSIVVLPFDDISPGKDNEYFSDGLTEEIITDLSKVRTLRVISRTSAMKLKGTDKSIQDIGRGLNVQYVLEGSVRKAGNDLRITAQLIDSRDDSHIWAEKYAGTLDDVFDMQEKVSRSIVDALKVKLSPEEDLRISQRPIDNVRAYEYYLRAQREVFLFSEDALDRALRYLQKGLDIVGDNSLLYAGMGYVHWQYINAGISTDDTHLDAVEQYANKCFELEPESPQGHLLLGLLEHARGNQPESIRHLRRVLAQDPRNIDAIRWLVITYSFVGKTSEASAMAEGLEVIDPLQSEFGVISWIRLVEGRLEDAAAIAREDYEKNPDNLVLGQWYGLMLAYNRRFDEASALTDRVTEDIRETYLARLYLFMKYAWEGKRAEAMNIVTPDFEAKTKRDVQYSWLVAGGYALLGDEEKALDWLENAVNLGFINYPYLNEYDPFLESIRGEKRFKELMKRVKYEWENLEI